MPAVPKKRKCKSGKERTGKGNNKGDKHRRQRIRTQLLDGNSQSDVTVQDVEALSRDPKRIKTVHVLGHCQRMCQEHGKLKGTSDVAFFVSTFVRALKSRGWGTGNKPLPTNWPGREKAYSELSVSLGQVVILQMGVRQGVSSGSDEQVGSSSQSSDAARHNRTYGKSTARPHVRARAVNVR